MQAQGLLDQLQSAGDGSGVTETNKVFDSIKKIAVSTLLSRTIPRQPHPSETSEALTDGFSSWTKDTCA